MFLSFERENAVIKNENVKFHSFEESKTKDNEEETNEEINEKKIFSVLEEDNVDKKT